MSKSDGYKNLIPANKRSKDEVRKIGQKGGKKSGEVRRMRKSLREQLLILLETCDTQDSICLALIDKALEGDTNAFKVIRDTIGEKPIDKVCMTTANVNLNESYREVKAIMEAQKQRLIEEYRHGTALIPDIEYEPLPHPLNLQENQASK